MSMYQLNMNVYVADEQRLLSVATAHIQRITDNPHLKVAGAEEAIRLLIDPGPGGLAYSGALSDAGIEIATVNTLFLNDESDVILAPPPPPEDEPEPAEGEAPASDPAPEDE